MPLMPFMPVQIFTIFQHLRYRHPMATFGMIAKWKTSTAGVERCQLDTQYKEETTKPCPNTILSRKGNDYFRVTHSPTAPQRFD